MAGDQAALWPAVPLPPDPGGEHDHHYVQDESLGAYRRYLLTAGEREAEVLFYLDRRGFRGATDDEGWRELRKDTPNQYAPTRTGLKKAGLVVWNGTRRETVAGNPAKVWVTAAAWVNHHRRGL